MIASTIITVIIYGRNNSNTCADITYSIDINVPTRSTLVLLTKDSFVSLRTNLNNKKQCLLAMMSRTEKKTAV